MTLESPLIVNCAHYRGQPGRFLADQFGDNLRWMFIDADASGRWNILQRIRRPNLARIKGGFDTGWSAAREHAALVISHDPRVTFSCETFLRLNSYRGPHLAFAFNFPEVPQGIMLRMMRSVLPNIDRFVVYSTMEKNIYHSTFGIPLDKIDFIHWGVNAPNISMPDSPSITGDYICALGENARDYATLFAAMRALPQIRLVVVARPHNLTGLQIPPNVDIRTNIPHGEAMNILAFSRFMVLPLAGSEVPCGHVTLVMPMHLGKSFVISNSTGVADYVRSGENSIACEPFSPDAMVDAIRKLWEDRDLCSRLEIAGKAFANAYCTEASTVAWLKHYFAAKGLL